MTIHTLTRWAMPGLLAVGLTAATLAPAPVRAQSNDELVQVLVNVADVVLRGNEPYYRGNYHDRLRVSRDRYGRPTYYRTVPRHGPPRHAPARGWRQQQVRRESCDRRGRCTVRYYDPRRDRSNRWR